ncbi:heat stress transcription factor B-4-like protein [Tanacetum coccineum]
MVLVDHTGWKLRRRQWTGTTEQLIEELELAYDNAPNMFSIRIHHGGKFQRYPGRMYVSGRVDIFDMVDIDLFTVVALNMMVLELGYTGKFEPMFYNYLKPLTSLDEGLYALACEEDVRYLGTLVRSFKLIEVYIEHGVTALDSYLKAPRFRATLEEITDEHGSIAANRIEKILLLTWHESNETTKEHVCESVTPSTLPQHDSSTPCKDSVCESITPSDINLSFVSQQATTSQVINYVMRQLSFDATELDGEAGFADVAGSGVDSSGLSHDESFGVNNLDLNLNEPVNLNVFQVETQSKLPLSEEPDVGRTHKPILSEVSTQEPIMTEEFSVEDVVLEDYVSFGEDAERGNGQEDESALTDGQFFYDDEGIDIAYETNMIMNLPFDNISITNLVSNDALEGEDVDVINANGFDSGPGNDEERNYRKRSEKFATLKEAKDIVYLHSIKSRRNLKLYKNDGVRIRAICDGKVPIFTMSQVRVNPDIPVKAVQDQLQRELKFHISMSKAFKAKAIAEREIRVDHILQYSMLRDYVVELQSTNPNTNVKIAVKRNADHSLPTRVFQRICICLGALKLGFRAYKRDLLGLDGAFMKGPFPGQVLVAIGLDSNNGIYPLAYALVEAESKSLWCWFLQCLGDDIDLHPNSNFTFISDRQKGWCGQAYKDLLWRAASATNVRDFEKCMLKLKTMNPKAHEWLNKIPAEHWARSHFSGRAKSVLLLNNICKVFNGKIVGGRDKPMITLLEYIREYCMKRIKNVQGVMDKCIGPLTPTATRIMESIKKEAHLMKVQWNGANKYQVSGLLGDHCVVDVVSMTCSCRKWELTGIPCGSGADVVICLSAAADEGGASAPSGASGPGGAGVASQGSSHSRWTKRRVQTEIISPQKRTLTQPANQPSTSSQVLVSETRNADGREMGDGVPTQSSAAGGASEWPFL